MVRSGTKMQVVEVDPYRARLHAGFIEAVAERGYAASTIADIVRHAKVSKRTFYEHFADKEACFLSTYVVVADMLLAAVREAFEGSIRGASWRAQLEAAVDAYVTALESQPALTRACLVEIQAAGPRALELRREVHERFAEMIRTFAARARKIDGSLRLVSAPMATALVGGLNELLVVQIERGPRHRLEALRRTATDLMVAVLSAPRVRPRGRRSA